MWHTVSCARRRHSAVGIRVELLLIRSCSEPSRSSITTRRLPAPPMPPPPMRLVPKNWQMQGWRRLASKLASCSSASC